MTCAHTTTYGPTKATRHHKIGPFGAKPSLFPFVMVKNADWLFPWALGWMNKPIYGDGSLSQWKTICMNN